MKSSWRTYACTVSSTPVSNVYHGRRGLPLLLPLLLHGWASTFPFVETAHPCLMKASVLRRTCGQPCSSRITVGVRHGHNIERLVRLAMSWKKTPSGQVVPCTAIVTCLPDASVAWQDGLYGVLSRWQAVLPPPLLVSSRQPLDAHTVNRVAGRRRARVKLNDYSI